MSCLTQVGARESEAAGVDQGEGRLGRARCLRFCQLVVDEGCGGMIDPLILHARARAHTHTSPSEHARMFPFSSELVLAKCHQLIFRH